MKRLRANENKKYRLDEIYDIWEESYGEDFTEEYDGLVEILKQQYPKGITRKQLAREWNDSYGENMSEDYSGFYDFLGLSRRDQEMVRESRKLEYEMAFYEWQKKYQGRTYGAENFVILDGNKVSVSELTPKMVSIYEKELVEQGFDIAGLMEQPIEEPPIEEPPVVIPKEKPPEEPPVEEPPVEEPPKEKPPEEPPVEEPPVEEPPVEEPPVESKLGNGGTPVSGGIGGTPDPIGGGSTGELDEGDLTGGGGDLPTPSEPSPTPAPEDSGGGGATTPDGTDVSGGTITGPANPGYSTVGVLDEAIAFRGTTLLSSDPSSVETYSMATETASSDSGVNWGAVGLGTGILGVAGLSFGLNGDEDKKKKRKRNYSPSPIRRNYYRRIRGDTFLGSQRVLPKNNARFVAQRARNLGMKARVIPSKRGFRVYIGSNRK